MVLENGRSRLARLLPVHVQVHVDEPATLSSLKDCRGGDFTGLPEYGRELRPIPIARAAPRLIDRAALQEVTAIIDPNYHRPAITGVRNSNPRSEAERSVRGGHSVRIEPLPRCR